MVRYLRNYFVHKVTEGKVVESLGDFGSLHVGCLISVADLSFQSHATGRNLT